KECVEEIIQFCKNNNLIRLWAYLWKEWYSKTKWILWEELLMKILVILKQQWLLNLIGDILIIIIYISFTSQELIIYVLFLLKKS
ncbi:hypothetical protein C1645_694507, partial [Glomus cerebriforme]